MCLRQAECVCTIELMLYQALKANVRFVILDLINVCLLAGTVSQSYS